MRNPSHRRTTTNIEFTILTGETGLSFSCVPCAASWSGWCDPSASKARNQSRRKEVKGWYCGRCASIVSVIALRAEATKRIAWIAAYPSSCVLLVSYFHIFYSICSLFRFFLALFSFSCIRFSLTRKSGSYFLPCLSYTRLLLLDSRSYYEEERNP